MVGDRIRDPFQITLKRTGFFNFRGFSLEIVEKTLYSLHGELSRLQYDTTWLSKQYLVTIIQLNISCGIKISLSGKSLDKAVVARDKASSWREQAVPVS